MYKCYKFYWKSIYRNNKKQNGEYDEEKVSEEQVEFTEGKSCSDSIVCLQQLITEKRVKSKETHNGFVDLEKVYFMIPRKLLCPVIRKMGIPQEILVLIKKMYARNDAQVKIGNMKSAGFRTNKGLKQGWGLSPSLFCFLRKCAV